MADAVDDAHGAYGRLHDVPHRDLLGRAGEHVAARPTGQAPDHAGVLQGDRELLEVTPREPRALGDGAEALRALGRLQAGKFEDHPEGVTTARGEFHRDFAPP